MEVGELYYAKLQALSERDVHVKFVPQNVASA